MDHEFPYGDTYAQLKLNSGMPDTVLRKFCYGRICFCLVCTSYLPMRKLVFIMILLSSFVEIYKIFSLLMSILVFWVYIYIYVYIYIHISGLHEPLTCSILCGGVPCPEKRLKEH